MNSQDPVCNGNAPDTETVKKMMAADARHEDQRRMREANSETRMLSPAEQLARDRKAVERTIAVFRSR